jgi:hypothetical protein
LVFELQSKPPNVITFGQRESDKINQIMINKVITY